MALPASFNTVEVRARYVDLLGQAAKGRLTFSPSVPALVAVNELTTIMSRPITVELNNQGEISVALPATDDPDITPSGFVYNVEESFTGLSGRKFQLSVPLSMASTGFDLLQAVPLPSGALFPTAFALQIIQHGDNPTVPRPLGAAAVYWIGSVEPTNGLAYDLFYDTSEV